MVDYGTAISLDDLGLEVGTPGIKSVGATGLWSGGDFVHWG